MAVPELALSHHLSGRVTQRDSILSLLTMLVEWLHEKVTNARAILASAESPHNILLVTTYEIGLQRFGVNFLVA